MSVVRMGVVTVKVWNGISLTTAALKLEHNFKVANTTYAHDKLLKDYIP